MVIVLSGGGTAGHINPALALAEVLIGRGHTVLFAGTPQGVEARLVAQAGIPFTPFEAAGFNRRHPMSIAGALRKILRSTAQAKRWFAEVGPDVVVGFGGYVCIPVGRAAHHLGIPVVVHEQNSVMGMANAYLAKRAAAVGLTYAPAASKVADKGKVVVCGNPVRSSILAPTREEGRTMLGIAPEAVVVLVMGGSLGARHLNTALAALKERLLAVPGLVVIQLTGPKEFDAAAAGLRLSEQEAKRWRLFGYQDRMGEVMAASDVAVSRAGATSLAEISARCLPALLVPYPFATDDHQSKNALAYTGCGAGVLVRDADVEGEAFARELFRLIENPQIRDDMGRAAAALGTDSAAHRLADVVIAAGAGGMRDTMPSA